MIIKNWIKKIKQNRFFRDTYYYLFANVFSDEFYIRLIYLIKMKAFLNLKKPKTLNEKIQWLKLNDRTKLHTTCADKIIVKDYVAKKIGKEFIIPTLKVIDVIEELTPENLPEPPFIIKTNHDSGSYKIVKDKSSVDWVEIRKYFKNKLNKNFYRISKEWQYKDIKPKILVEALLVAENNERLEDYKFICINGKVAMINVDLNKDIEHHRNNYDLDWSLLPFLWPCEIDNGKKIERPITFDKMVRLAEILSADFKFCRVDFYTLGKSIFFGEITFHPTSGFGMFKPSNWDLEFGKRLKIK